WRQSASRRSLTRKPAAAALSQLALLSSPATTAAPPARSAWQAARPERAKPNTATVAPEKVVIGIMLAFYPESAPPAVGAERSPLAGLRLALASKRAPGGLPCARLTLPDGA